MRRKHLFLRTRPSGRRLLSGLSAEECAQHTRNANTRAHMHTQRETTKPPRGHFERAQSGVAAPNTNGCGRSWETGVQGRNEHDLKMLSD